MASFDLLIAEPGPLVLTVGGNAYVLLVFPPAGDASPPLITQLDPPVSQALGKTQPISFRLTDNQGYALRELWVGFGVAPAGYELAHDGTAFRGAYAAASTLTEQPDGALDFVLRRTSGWPYGGRVRLRCNVVDQGGNVVVVSA